MTYKELKKIANRNGMVRWTRSGMYEKLGIEGRKVVAWGIQSQRHFITPHSGQYDVVEVNPKEPVAVGEILFPRAVPTAFIQAKVQERRWYHYKRQAEKLVRE